MPASGHGRKAEAQAEELQAAVRDGRLKTGRPVSTQRQMDILLSARIARLHSYEPDAEDAEDFSVALLQRLDRDGIALMARLEYQELLVYQRLGQLTPDQAARLRIQLLDLQRKLVVDGDVGNLPQSLTINVQVNVGRSSDPGKPLPMG